MTPREQLQYCYELAFYPPRLNEVWHKLKAQPPAPRYRILRPEDEAEVERLYQRLKAVGNLDQKNSDEK